MKLGDYIYSLQELYRKLHAEQGDGDVEVLKGIFEAPPPTIELGWDSDLQETKVIQV